MTPLSSIQRLAAVFLTVAGFSVNPACAAADQLYQSEGAAEIVQIGYEFSWSVSVNDPAEAIQTASLGSFGVEWSPIEAEEIEEEKDDGTLTLPEDPKDLDDGWKKDPTHKDPNGTKYVNEDGTAIFFDVGRPGLDGWKGKDHRHVENPNWKPQDKDENKYLDEKGRPCRDNSSASHIEPGTKIPFPDKKE